MCAFVAVNAHGGNAIDAGSRESRVDDDEDDVFASLRPDAKVQSRECNCSLGHAISRSISSYCIRDSRMAVSIYVAG